MLSKNEIRGIYSVHLALGEKEPELLKALLQGYIFIGLENASNVSTCERVKGW